MGTDGEAVAAQAWADTTAFDRAHLRHPYAAMTDPAPVWPVVSAEGCA